MIKTSSRKSNKTPVGIIVLTINLINEIKEEMKRQNLSQERFASKIDMTQPALSRRLKYPHTITFCEFLKMWGALGMDVTFETRAQETDLSIQQIFEKVEYDLGGEDLADPLNKIWRTKNNPKE